MKWTNYATTLALLFAFLVISITYLLNWKNLLRLMPKTVQAQAKHETGNYTSYVFTDLNNLFGMKNADHRFQLGRQIEGTSYRYYSWKWLSILDHWLYRMKVGGLSTNDPVDYVNRLAELDYFEDDYYNYLGGLKYYMK